MTTSSYICRAKNFAPLRKYAAGDPVMVRTDAAHSDWAGHYGTIVSMANSKFAVVKFNALAEGHNSLTHMIAVEMLEGKY